MSDNRILIENLAKQIPKIDVCGVCGVCSVWNYQNSNKTNILIAKKSTTDSMFENVCAVWNEEENSEHVELKTIQTKDKQDSVCKIFDEKSKETPSSRTTEELQTIQTHQTDESSNVNNIDETKLPIFPYFVDLATYVDFYEERAAIYELDARDVAKNRAEAQQLAMADTLNLFIKDIKMDI